MHSGNPYAEWVKAQSESFHVARTERLIAETAPGEFVRSPTPDDLKTSKCRLAVGIAAQVSEQSTSGTPYLVESLLQAVERMPATHGCRQTV